ncbi:unnamed protein product [marine sediment metagenome]|uniref:Uncharacterized protein n=1 Tax=marine sediment metagenome TaxID=412755 RepID=X1J7C2_9ZZZZ
MTVFSEINRGFINYLLYYGYVWQVDIALGKKPSSATNISNCHFSLSPVVISIVSA